MHYMKIEKASISNGLGVRVVLWCAGCSRKCKGCFNPETWSYEAGKPFNNTAKSYLFEQLSKPYVKGLTCSGGHPFEPENLSDVTELLREIKQRFPEKDIWLYTGFTWEQVKAFEAIKYIDVLVDGPYIEEQRDITLAFRGSSNQRLIDVKQTLKQGSIILLNP
ncbi:MAG: anaerobic ribonucleoside-triphosphate reductase activating protein [Lachnospiraceae bacterium]